MDCLTDLLLHHELMSGLVSRIQEIPEAAFFHSMVHT